MHQRNELSKQRHHVDAHKPQGRKLERMVTLNSKIIIRRRRRKGRNSTTPISKPAGTLSGPKEKIKERKVLEKS